MASKTLSLGVKIRRDLLAGADRSAIDIFVTSCCGLFAANPAAGDQMAMRPDEIFRLKAAGVMQRLEDPGEKARPTLVLRGNRYGCNSCPRS
jgi:hypothetical protein